MLAVSKDFTLDLDQLLPVREKERSPETSCRRSIPAPDMWRDIGHLVDKAARDKAAGQGLQDEHGRRRGRDDGNDRRALLEMALDGAEDPAPVQGGLRPAVDARRARRGQDRPDGASPVSSNTLAHQILGNSVIWSAWRAVGQFLGTSINDHSGVLDLDPEIRQMSLFEILERMDRENTRRMGGAEPVAARGAAWPAFARWTSRRMP